MECCKMGVRRKPRVWTNKDGTVSKAWVVDYTDNGGKRRNEQFDHKREADQAWAKIQLDLGKNAHIPARQTATVKYCSELWYAHAKPGKSSKRRSIPTRDTRKTLTIVSGL